MKKLGMKWFVFFKTVRPILTILTGISIVFDFVMYYETYLMFPLLFLQFVSSLICTALQITLLFHSEEHKAKLFKLIKRILIYDIFYVPFQNIVSNYYTNQDILVLSAIMAISFYYFIWYKLNIKYFSKRLLTQDELPPVVEEEIL